MDTRLPLNTWSWAVCSRRETDSLCCCSTICTMVPYNLCHSICWPTPGIQQKTTNFKWNVIHITRGTRTSKLYCSYTILMRRCCVWDVLTGVSYRLKASSCKSVEQIWRNCCVMYFLNQTPTATLCFTVWCCAATVKVWCLFEVAFNVHTNVQ